MYGRPTLEGEEPTTFGVSGKLWRSSLVMYDRQTKSLWSQVDGTAMAGMSAGAELSLLPSSLTTWREWKERHPETLVLAKPALDGSAYDRYHRRDWVGLPWFRSRDDRLPAKTLVLGVEAPAGATPVAIELEHLALRGPLTFEHAGRVLLAAAAPGSQSAHLFVVPEEIAGDGEWSLLSKDGETVLVERSSGLTWEWPSGAPSSESAPVLEPLAVSPIYWGIWSRFYADSELLKP